uniref:Uncharacterized protein n=1 Tax=Amphimedon queenslandica TaxID=400682 RepID=A0A1X7UKS9_AMPQE
MAEPAEYPPHVKSIISEVEKWLESINYTLRLEFKESNPRKGLVEYDIPGLDEAALFIHDQSSKTYFNIGFKMRVTPDSSLEDLQKNLDYVALDRLPMPGFNTPRGWAIVPQTAMSSFKEGVKIISYENGHIVYTIETEFFSIYGSMPGKEPPCGLPAAPGTFFRLEFEENKKLKCVMKVDMAISYK